MPAASVAYLGLVLAAYAVFVVVLGAQSLRTLFAKPGTRPQPAMSKPAEAGERNRAA